MRSWMLFHRENASAVASIWILAKVSSRRRRVDGVEGQQRFVLGVNGGEVRRQLTQYGDRRRLVVDEYPAFAAGRNLAPQDDRFVFLVDSVVFEDLRDRLFGSAFDFKNGGDRGLVGPRANHVAGGFVTQKKRQGINEDGFPGAGLAGQKIQAGRELYRQVVYDRVVF